MATAWTVPVGSDIWQIVSKKAVVKVDEDALGGKEESGDFDGTLDTRAKKAVENAVKLVRGSIAASGRFAISLTAGSVPPEGVQHTLVIAAYVLCGPVPGLLSIVLMDGGMYSPLAKLYAEACKWLEWLRAGGIFTVPTDPDTTLGGSIIWGDNLGDDDEYAAGITDDGVVISRRTQDMLTW